MIQVFVGAGYLFMAFVTGYLLEWLEPFEDNKVDNDTFIVALMWPATLPIMLLALLCDYFLPGEEVH